MPPLTLQVEWNVSVYSSIKITPPGHTLARQEYLRNSLLLLYIILMWTIQTLLIFVLINPI